VKSVVRAASARAASLQVHRGVVILSTRPFGSNTLIGLPTWGNVPGCRLNKSGLVLRDVLRDVSAPLPTVSVGAARRTGSDCAFIKATIANAMIAAVIAILAGARMKPSR